MPSITARASCSVGDPSALGPRTWQAIRRVAESIRELMTNERGRYTPNTWMTWGGRLGYGKARFCDAVPVCHLGLAFTCLHEPPATDTSRLDVPAGGHVVHSLQAEHGLVGFISTTWAGNSKQSPHLHSVHAGLLCACIVIGYLRELGLVSVRSCEVIFEPSTGCTECSV